MMDLAKGVPNSVIEFISFKQVYLIPEKQAKKYVFKQRFIQKNAALLST